MATRIILGTVMVAATAGVLWLDWQFDRPAADLRGAAPPNEALRGLPSTLLLVGLTAVGFFEFARLAKALDAPVLPVSGLIATLAMGSFGYWFPLLNDLLRSDDWPWPVTGFVGLNLLGLLLGLLFAEQMVRRQTQGALRRIAATVLAVVYLGVCGQIVLSIRLADGVPALAWFLAAVKFTDVGAYLTGTAIGRHKMVPWLSPGKSWEGLAGGLLVGAAAGVLVAWGLNLVAPGRLWQVAVMGLLVGLAGQFADLCESLLKRSARLKDSGALVPQFGGVLDIVDSVLLAAPVASILLALRPLRAG